MTNILFVCKHNRFRSRVANAYFRKINKNPLNQARGAGIYQDYCTLDRDEFVISKKFGINIAGKPKKIKASDLKWQNKIIIVADDVPKSKIKNYKKYDIIVWKIHDIEDAKDKNKAITDAVKKIMAKVKKLVKELGVKK